MLSKKYWFIWIVACYLFGSWLAYVDAATIPLGWNQAAGNPGRNSYRSDLPSDPLAMKVGCLWTTAPDRTISRVQLVSTSAGLRLWEVWGVPGGYDDPWKNTPHANPYVTRLRDLDCKILANSGPSTPVAATFEGPWAAFWKHPTLTNYEIARFLDGGQATATISGVKGTSLTTGLIGGYREEVGMTAVNEDLSTICQLNRRAWHGGTRPYVRCEKYKAPTQTTNIWQGQGWYAGIPDEDGLEPGSALAMGNYYMAYTLNRRREKDKQYNGFRSHPIGGNGLAYEIQGGTWSAPAVSADGIDAYAVQNGTTLVELNMVTGNVRNVQLHSGRSNQDWLAPPVVTDRHVLIIEPGSTENRGDLVAYDRATLTFAWRQDAQIVGKLDLLSGFIRSDVYYVACNQNVCYVAGNDGLFALRESDGSYVRWIFSDPLAEQGFMNPQLFDGGMVIQNNIDRTWARCQRNLCPDGKPVGRVDYGRCCRGTTFKCQNVDCKVCEQMMGWCPNSDEKFRMLSPSDTVWVLKSY